MSIAMRYCASICFLWYSWSAFDVEFLQFLVEEPLDARLVGDPARREDKEPLRWVAGAPLSPESRMILVERLAGVLIDGLVDALVD